MNLMIYTFDQDGLHKAALVENYESLIWNKRFFQPGECELYLPATTEMVALIQPGTYLVRDDDAMICRVKKIELQTSAEQGSHLIVVGEDASAILDQRIVWNTATCYGNLETFIRKLVDENLVNPARTERAFPALTLGTAAGITKRLSEQVSYVNLGEKIREYCRAYGFGYQIVKNGNGLEFNLLPGTDRSSSVIFCEDYENLAETSYVRDTTDASNVALVAGEGEGANRARAVFGYASGYERREMFVDQRDLGSEASYDELVEAYPLIASGGNGYISGTEYKLTTCVIHVYDGNQKAWLDDNYPGGTYGTAADGSMTYTLTDVAIADLPSSTPDSYDTVKYRNLIYSMWLAASGADNIQTAGSTESFTGTVIPDVTFKYGTDYTLGDIVTVRNRFGIEAAARVTEILECFDTSGYHMEPSYEYILNDSQTTVPAGEENLYTGAGSMIDAEVRSLAAIVGGNMYQATGAQNTPTALTANQITKVQLVSTGAISLGSGFSLDDGGIRITETGHYLISASVFLTTTSGSGVTEKNAYIYKGGTFATANEVAGSGDSVYANANLSGGVGVTRKLVNGTAGDIFYLACRMKDGPGSVYEGNVATFLLVEKVEPAASGGGTGNVTITQNVQTGGLSIS